MVKDRASTMISNGSFSTILNGLAGCSPSELVSCVPLAARMVGNGVRGLGLVPGFPLRLRLETEEGPSDPSSETSAIH